ncbi:D-galactose-binding periplasmic protein precursor [Clostridium saccharobutylicum]|uniref:galactose ABC transporter substrate-binding protein n=1 Tax=Clostridium saccharobutylicum TaxID=169679 RepID=UPI000983B54A|nr:galactose ABC transporter substrate-binding protein [Clostridium saccharobutylicum]AQS11431.1 D-galactose-binding periplasmic protein precursor [Clostridium saccharobutylicum]MBC2435165.1 galactose ABC transporter substrate-binding protein [Clostridium saccharobutylicum]NSB88644.1 methyl-galactoside transport system substrate-binding protein [Clostridium saccharobutylicum]NYC30589.1 methyl-galactoside transport system substrate-binding protein [Clostridium saccharobutylicum]OOM14776.1 D-gal
MKTLTRALSFITILFLMSGLLINLNKKNIKIVSAETAPAKVAVFLLDFNDDFIAEIADNLKAVQNENSGKVEYTFYDGKSDQSVQNAQIEKALDEGVDLVLLNIVDRANAQNVMNRIKEHNVPVILFNREPVSPVPIKSYGKAIYIGTDGAQAGALEAKMVIDAWNASSQYIDKNNDKIMQYVMLQGEADNSEALQRTKSAVSTIDKSGISAQQVALIADWREDLAYNATKQLYERYKDQIEVIIANDDTMALGAIKALQEYGYNNGDISKTIPVVGVDATPPAKELIQKGQMLGSVYQDARAYAEALYLTGMNMIAGKNPIEGTKYIFDYTQVSIRLPQTKYFYRNMFTGGNAIEGTIETNDNQ